MKKEAKYLQKGDLFLDGFDGPFEVLSSKKSGTQVLVNYQDQVDENTTVQRHLTLPADSLIELF